MRNFFVLMVGLVFVCCGSLFAENELLGTGAETQYTVGVDDILEVAIIQPEVYESIVTVAPDGNISFPYIGSVYVKGLSLAEVQQKLESLLADGYLKYPVVTVFLQQSLSRKFFVYGEVVKPGTYLINENTTVLRAISIAGGFTKFGSSSKVKILRERKSGVGYDTIKINIKAVMNGDSDSDILLVPGDMVVVSEGIF